jgi:hypothetical protein
MSSARENGESRRLLDQLAGARELGTPEGILATTFDLNPTFIELDYLPTVLGISTMDDATQKGRLELEQQLDRTESVALLMEGRRYQGRPRSLRAHLTPASLPSGSVLHAKLSLIVYADAVRLMVASANLTEDGYRHNREVGLSVLANAKRSSEARWIAEALDPMKEVLAPWWGEHATRVLESAQRKLSVWSEQTVGDDDDRFLWSGPRLPLWSRFLELWPADEPVRELFIVSPFWSDESREGPLSRLLQGFRARGTDVSGARVRLITGAERDREATFRPAFPAGFGEFDFRTLGVNVIAAAASPKVEADDIGGSEVLRERRLHAKGVLVVGPKTSLAYAGSANFTMPGWGFGSERTANIEAGVAFRRRGKARESLRQILPPTCAEVELDGTAAGLLVVTSDLGAQAEKPFPAFLRSVELRQEAGNAARLELVAELVEQALGGLEMSLSGGDVEPRRVLLSVQLPSAERSYRVALDAESVRDLIRQRALFVRWEDSGTWLGAEFPLNVSLAAREELPFADPSALPGENELLAFYQGRLAFSDVFPEEPDAPEDGGTRGAAIAGSKVDTSEILSYQMRSFVEALPGVRRELSQSTASKATIRFAFLGPVSPVALAKEVVKHADRGRSATAAAFQLLEILGCVRSVKPAGVLPEALAAAWTTTVGRASGEIEQMYQQLVEKAPVLLENSSFRQYERAMRSVGGAS